MQKERKHSHFNRCTKDSARSPTPDSTAKCIFHFRWLGECHNLGSGCRIKHFRTGNINTQPSHVCVLGTEMCVVFDVKDVSDPGGCFVTETQKHRKIRHFVAHPMSPFRVMHCTKTELSWEGGCTCFLFSAPFSTSPSHTVLLFAPRTAHTFFHTTRCWYTVENPAPNAPGLNCLERFRCSSNQHTL